MKLWSPTFSFTNPANENALYLVSCMWAHYPCMELTVGSIVFKQEEGSFIEDTRVGAGRDLKLWFTRALWKDPVRQDLEDYTSKRITYVKSFLVMNHLYCAVRNVWQWRISAVWRGNSVNYVRSNFPIYGRVIFVWFLLHWLWSPHYIQFCLGLVCDVISILFFLQSILLKINHLHIILINITAIHVHNTESNQLLKIP